MRAIFLLVLLVLAGCGDSASTYDPKRDHYVDTEQYRKDQINREINRREVQRNPI